MQPGPQVSLDRGRGRNGHERNRVQTKNEFVLADSKLTHDCFTHVGNSSVAHERNGEHNHTHVMKDSGAIGIGMHKHGQTHHHGNDNGIVGGLVDLALNQHAKEHGKDDTTALHESLGGVIDILHGQIGL
jgi:hypothetical protein